MSVRSTITRLSRECGRLPDTHLVVFDTRQAIQGHRADRQREFR
jgi:hypothetical protein